MGLIKAISASSKALPSSTKVWCFQQTYFSKYSWVNHILRNQFSKIFGTNIFFISRDRWTEIWLTNPCGYIFRPGRPTQYRLHLGWESQFEQHFPRILQNQKTKTIRSISSAFRTILLALFLIKRYRPIKSTELHQWINYGLIGFKIAAHTFNMVRPCESLTYWFIPYLSIHVPPFKICGGALSWLIYNLVLLINVPKFLILGIVLMIVS